jgi:ankyrin repeat protein
LNAWDSFWKGVHSNNQALWAAAEKGDLNTIK